MNIKLMFTKIQSLKSGLILGCLFISFGYSFAQGNDEIFDTQLADSIKVDKKKTPKERKNGAVKKLELKGLYIGSGLGFNVWNSTIRFDVSPHVGYRIGDVLLPGVGLTYIFFNDVKTKLSTNVVGPKFMMRIRPIKNIPTLDRFYLHGEAEYLTLIQKSGGRTLSDHQTRINAGVGYTTNFGDGFGFTTEVLFDFYYLKTGWTYLNPITYRIGFYYGF